MLYNNPCGQGTRINDHHTLFSHPCEETEKVFHVDLITLFVCFFFVYNNMNCLTISRESFRLPSLYKGVIMGITSIILTAALFMAMILNLAAKPRHSAQITGGAILFASLSGMILYGYGFAQVLDDFYLAVIRSTLAICGMFVGKNDLSVIASADFMQNRFVIIWFWIAHTCALYATASAAITAVGAETLKKIRLALARRGTLVLIYGTNDSALSFGAKKNTDRHASVVFVDDKVPSDAISRITAMGAVLRTDSHALHPDLSFFRSLGMTSSKRRIEVYALSENEHANVAFAKDLLIQFEALSHDPETLSLSLPGSEEEFAPDLQSTSTQYGYGFVHVFDPSELPARLMVRKCPTWDRISFDENGKALEDFDCVILGFGHSGQAALKYLAMNGQFEGSHFHAAVFAVDGELMSGKMQVELSGLFSNYDIQFYNADGRSVAFYQYLKKHAASIRYIAVCVGPEEVNNEITSEINSFAISNQMKTAIVQCYHFGIRAQSLPSDAAVSYDALSDETLTIEKLDRMAMLLNHSYSGEVSLTPWETWLSCNHFNRMSCRAATDFFPAFLKMSGITEEEALDGKFHPEGKLLLNLSRTEHLRWNAFHFCMGYLTMPEKTWEERAAIYLQQSGEGKPSIRISKDADARLHACLVSWDELVILSEKEEKITHKPVDYQKMDQDNVLAIPSLLKEKYTAEKYTDK